LCRKVSSTSLHAKLPADFANLRCTKKKHSRDQGEKKANGERETSILEKNYGKKHCPKALLDITDLIQVARAAFAIVRTKTNN
jgi:hypothetical protein